MSASRAEFRQRTHPETIPVTRFAYAQILSVAMSGALVLLTWLPTLAPTAS